MQLLYDSPLSSPQFVALTILLQPTSSKDSVPMICVGGEPILTVAPTANLHRQSVREALQELHRHLIRVLDANINSKGNKNSATAFFMQEDVDSVQVFRPLAARGIALHYQFIRNDNAMNIDAVKKLAELVISENKTNGSVKNIDDSVGIAGVLLTLGITGAPIMAFHASDSNVPYSISQRMTDCIGILQKSSDIKQAKQIMKTFLLDSVKTNDMVEAPQTLVLSEAQTNEGSRIAGGVVGGLKSPIGGMISPIAEFGRRNKTSNQSKTETVIYPLRFAPTSSESSKSILQMLSVMSVAENDSRLRKYEVSGQERKANLDFSSKSRFRRRKSDGKGDPDFDNFDYKGPVKEMTLRKVLTSYPAPSIPSDLASTSSNATGGGGLGSNIGGKAQLRSSRKDTKTKSGQPKRLSNDMQRHSQDEETSQHTRNSSNYELSTRRRKQHEFDDISEATPLSHSGSHELNGGSVVDQTKIQVNVALNEDLTCLYKLSQLSSCIVEGVVQALVKSTTRPNTNTHFCFLIRDPSNHIESISENRQIVETTKSEGADYAYYVTVPKQDQYFPILKYECSGNLRPVPIRVQTKVITEGKHCRVALQISSNPVNTASLTDLTIVMGIPDNVLGETLATQPAGGVFDKTKRSVIWCVSELGGGEKFQLQARFQHEEIRPSDLIFPVLVRCQCLHMQLSDIEFEVRESDILPADIDMRIARRYRLSHREKHA